MISIEDISYAPDSLNGSSCIYFLSEKTQSVLQSEKAGLIIPREWCTKSRRELSINLRQKRLRRSNAYHRVANDASEVGIASLGLVVDPEWNFVDFRVLPDSPPVGDSNRRLNLIVSRLKV